MTANSFLILIILLSGFYMAWNIGANDVANAMGTSVGSGALGLRQAIFIAAVLEFCGAFFFGSHVSETIQSGIINPDYFVDNPRTLVLGMLASLIGTGLWLQIASYFGWPISATHTIIGALVGFGLLIDGVHAIYWDKVYSIIFSWLLSPFLGGFISFFLFTYLRKKIFYRTHPLEAAKRAIPKITFLVITMLSLVLFFHSFDEASLDDTFVFALLISCAVGFFAFIVATFLVKKQALALQPARSSNFSPELSFQLEKAKKALSYARTLSQGEMTFQINAILDDLKSTSGILVQPEEYERTSEEFTTIEKMFGWLQIISACLMAFSHGANDVANAIGPVSASIAILQTGVTAVHADIPSWVLALGGFGIVFGLATWGWRVIETVGKKITELTPTRGFAAEFGAAFTVLIASRFGLPVSTTHTLIGAVIGVGLARGIGALNLGMMRDIVASWAITVPAGALMSIIVFTLLAPFFG
ncbi:Inorganic phosphate transporter 2-1, chloroplastic [Chlamydiales bacterium STE3]|nr:Inorganic phosphate transporter 2-1, chloroplastic [Chlamydiales bacterium STE3]